MASDNESEENNYADSMNENPGGAREHVSDENIGGNLED